MENKTKKEERADLKIKVGDIMIINKNLLKNTCENFGKICDLDNSTVTILVNNEVKEEIKLSELTVERIKQIHGYRKVYVKRGK